MMILCDSIQMFVILSDFIGFYRDISSEQNPDESIPVRPMGNLAVLHDLSYLLQFTHCDSVVISLHDMPPHSVVNADCHRFMPSLEWIRHFLSARTSTLRGFGVAGLRTVDRILDDRPLVALQKPPRPGRHVVRSSVFGLRTSVFETEFSYPRPRP